MQKHIGRASSLLHSHNLHGAYIWVKTGKDNMTIVAVFEHHREDNIQAFVALHVMGQTLF